ncbi:MAG TPA: DEAD/DEAH box helicase [Rhodanobacteraceae bacterium]|nr:DEAD/DEAH box helicase [Rhodanobacteraceae bacterium]
MSFESLGLQPALLRALAALGYETPTPVQAEAVPLILAGRDLLAGSQTGTGKTAAFTLPLLQRLFPAGQRPASATARVRALVLTPTRELAVQIHESVRAYGKHLPLKSAQVFGGVGMQPQVQALRAGVDVLIATPGRLIDHLQQRTVDLRGIDTLVLDEADRMLDMGFLPALKKILAALPKERQTLLFSATYADEIKQLAAQFLRDPAEIQIARQNSVVDTIAHRIFPVDSERKRDLLVEVLRDDSRRQVLVFARTKHGSDRLAKQLCAAGFRADAIHGNKSQNARQRALNDFKAGRVTVLVATDIAARGLDIEQLPMVVNYDLPNVPEDYVHRIGRTGRNGATGLALSLVSRDEEEQLHGILKLLKTELETITIPGFEPRQPVRTSLPSPRAPKAAHRPHGNGASAQAPSQRPRRRRGGGGARPAAPSARS